MLVSLRIVLKNSIFVTIYFRDFEREFFIGPRWGLGSSTALNEHKVRCQWKPMGALQWVEKGCTEVLSGRKELEFVTKVLCKLYEGIFLFI